MRSIIKAAAIVAAAAGPGAAVAQAPVTPQMIEAARQQCSRNGTTWTPGWADEYGRHQSTYRPGYRPKPCSSGGRSWRTDELGLGPDGLPSGGSAPIGVPRLGA